MSHAILPQHFAFTFLAGVLLVIATAGCGPSTPKDGFSGDWKPKSVFPIETRPLPPASNVWTDFKQWKGDGKPSKERYYLARLGGAHRQRNLDVSYGYSDTPLGRSTYTSARFGYLDETNGDYTLTWEMRGRHKPEFLRFTTRERIYYLLPYGKEDEYPPQLAVVGIEGVSPFR